MVEVGDWVLVNSEKVGSVTGNGVVTAIAGQLITRPWDSGSEAVVIPSAGSVQVTAWSHRLGSPRTLDLRIG